MDCGLDVDLDNTIKCSYITSSHILYAFVHDIIVVLFAGLFEVSVYGLYIIPLHITQSTL